MSISSSFRSRIQNSNISNQYYEVEQTKQKDKDRILRGLKPLFFEMKIIKKVFQDLESLVNYQIDAQNQNQQDSMNALFHFSKAKSTFLQLRNQTGLSRCYYNLGILKMLKNNFILAQEYFESAINLSIEAFGTGFQSLQSQKILQQHNQSADNYIIMVFKQLLSKSYSLKQQALDLIYQDDSQKEIYDHKYDDFTYISQKTTIKQLQNYSLEINKLLIQSLRAFESAQKLVHNNDQSFSEIQKIFLFQEIIEILTYLKQSEKTQSQLFSLVKQLLLTAEQKISNNFNLFRGANFYTNKQVLQIQNAKQYFLQGLKEYFQNNLILAFELFTLCLEEGTHYDPFLKKKAMFYINQLTKQTMRLPQQLYMKEQMCLLQERKKNFQFTILLQLDKCIEYTSIRKYLITIYQLNIFRKGDKIQVLAYHSSLDTLMPFFTIDKQQDINLILNSLASLENLIIQNENHQINQLNWQQALHLALWQIQEFSLQQIIELKQQQNQNNIKQMKNKFQQNYENNKQSIKQNILLLFSQDQNQIKQFKDQKLDTLYHINRLKKPVVYHLNYFSSDTKNLVDSNSYFTYESFFDENQFTSKLNLLRNEENHNIYQEFLAILNT